MRPLEKVIGYNSIKKEFYKIIDVLNNPEKYEKLGVHIPNGVMLEGEPGIGKSLMAKCFIEECKRKSYIIRKDKPNGNFVDYIRETFEDAEKKAPTIILLDDMDKYANEDYSHRDAEEYVTIQACIDNVKDKNVFVIATVNDIESLPGSLVRSGRFDNVFHMDFPRGEDAKKIIEYYLKDKKCDSTIDTEEISRYMRGYSCASLETFVNKAGMRAAYENRSVISHEDLKNTCLQEIYRFSDDAEVPEDVVRMRVVHEAGHTVISEIRNPGMITFVSASTKRIGRIGGLVSRDREIGYRSTIKDEETEILIGLAGKAAVEVVLGEIDMGVSSDMHKVFDGVRDLLDAKVSYDFNSWCHGEETSEKIYDHLDITTGVEVSRYYMMAKQMLIQNRAFLDAIIKELMDKKFLSYKDIAKIRKEGGF